jgi:hypothetical protein
VVNLKSFAVLATLLVGACADPENPVPVVALNDADAAAAAYCTNGTFTGRGLGFTSCMQHEREALAEANPGHEALVVANAPQVAGVAQAQVAHAQ